jgi:hypothetical protein
MLLNDLITKKAQQTRKQAVSFENSLASEFRSLTAKSGENLLKVEKQVDLYTHITKKENNIANSIAVISAMMSKNSLLEQLVYSKIEQKLSVFPKKTDEVEVKKPTATQSTKPKQKKPTKPKSSVPSVPQTKLAEGGVVSATGIEKKKNVDPNIIPYADTLSLAPQASGIAAITTLGEFIKGTGALGGFFKPYLDSVITPFALALGVSQNMINTLLGGPVQAATLDLKDQQKYFGKTWGKFLNDSDFVDKFIDRIMDPNDPNKPSGYVPANWKDDPEFTAELNRVAKKFNINANDLLAVMLVETGGTLNPAIRNPKSDATGLIQFIPSTARGLGTTVDELAKMSRAQQMKYVEKYFDNKLPQGASGGQIYAAVFLPAFIKEEVLTVRGEAYYNANVGLDYNNDGKITRSDLDAHVEAKKKQYKLERGGSIGTGPASIAPYLMSGSESGYDAIIQGIKVTLHGDEVVVPSEDGFQVYPVKNKRYDIFEDPLGVTKRWKEIAKGANTQNVLSFSSGGSAEFWKIAALASKEDSLHPQGQADVAQSLYNRAAIGSYPGGKSISSIITAPGQYQPTFNNAATWNAIRDRKSAIAAAGNAQKVDMASKSITNPFLQKEAQRFVGGRTDFMGESQKPYMKPGDITRGKGYNFHGWFYNAKLPKPAPVPKMVSSQTTAAASTEKVNPKVVINRAKSQPQPNLVQQVQSAITYIPNIIFNPHRLKKELNMRRAR